MKGDEARVEDAFCEWLHQQGWTTQRQVNYVDVLATAPDGSQLFAEAKGSSPDVGIDADIMYGQLLRRMAADHGEMVRYAAVVRDDPRSVRAVTRVGPRVRELLRIDLYAVAEDGAVRRLE